jgi:hypothetical protein
MAWLQENYAVVISVLFAISELLGGIEAIKANSVYQLIFGILGGLKKAILPPAPPKA